MGRQVERRCRGGGWDVPMVGSASSLSLSVCTRTCTSTTTLDTLSHESRVELDVWGLATAVVSRLSSELVDPVARACGFL
jgi:hypothetical protein